jgi:hypothetical protein
MKLQRVGGPGLKSETWAAHSTFVRASFIVSGEPQAGVPVFESYKSPRES